MKQHTWPSVKGTYKFDFNLRDISFFKVGGKCDVYFQPTDALDLQNFLTQIPNDIDITVLGNVSNVLILDNGIRGCVINLANFNKIMFEKDFVVVDAGVQLSSFIKHCIDHNLSCCEKLFCIPGTIGGAISMNAGIPSFEIGDALISVDCIKFNGERITFKRKDLNMTYRDGNIGKDLIVVSATFNVSTKEKIKLQQEVNDIIKKRRASQPIGAYTCGSTFKNPPGEKAWELIQLAECKNLNVGDAFVSDIHSNFLINKGNATSSDFLKLINIIKQKVLQHTGILLEEEIKTIGEP